MHVKVARAEQIFQWSHYWIMRRVLGEKGPMSTQRLRLEIALKMYGHEMPVRQLIEKALADVPHLKRFVEQSNGSLGIAIENPGTSLL